MPNKPKKVPPGYHRMADGRLMKGESHAAAKKSAAKRPAAKKARPRRYG